jgi:hypothetical protein
MESLNEPIIKALGIDQVSGITNAQYTEHYLKKRGAYERELSRFVACGRKKNGSTVQFKTELLQHKTYVIHVDPFTTIHFTVGPPTLYAVSNIFGPLKIRIRGDFFYIQFDKHPNFLELLVHYTFDYSFYI